MTPASLAIRYIIVAEFFFAIMGVSVKALQRLSFIEVSFFRGVIPFLFCIYFIKRRGISLWGNHKGALLMRGGVGTLALMTFFYVLQVMPLASAVTIQYLHPLFTLLITQVLLKEKTSLRQYLFILLALIGVALVKGFDTDLQLVHVLAGILSAFLSGLAHSLIRSLGGKEDPLVIMFYFPLVLIPTAGALSIFQWVMPQGVEWLLIVILGISVQLAQWNMTKALTTSPAANFVQFNYIGPILAALLGYFLFQEKVSIQGICGISLTMIGVAGSSFFTTSPKEIQTGHPG